MIFCLLYLQVNLIIGALIIYSKEFFSELQSFEPQQKLIYIYIDNYWIICVYVGIATASSQIVQFTHI